MKSDNAPATFLRNSLCTMAIRPHQMLTTLGVVLCSAAWVAPVTTAEPAWRTGEEMRRELQTPLGITWSAQLLREAMSNLSANQRVAIWLDRRIDPSRELEFTFRETPLQQILQQVAARLGVEVGYVGPVVYIGPPSVAAKLWTISELRQEESRRLPADLRAKWALRRPTQWPELSIPRELLQTAADEGGCTIEGLDTIPHDLWPAANFPPLTLVERLTLMLAGFDRTFEYARDGRVIRLTPLPERSALQREYTPRGDVSRAATDLTRRFPNANIQRTGVKLAITGSAEDHDAISRQLRGEPVRRTPTGPAKIQYKMTVTNQPLGAVLRTLELESQLQVTVDEAARDKLRDLVSFEVKDATLEQLLQAATQGTGLTIQLEGLRLRITLADK